MGKKSKCPRVAITLLFFDAATANGSAPTERSLALKSHLRQMRTINACIEGWNKEADMRSHHTFCVCSQSMLMLIKSY